MYTIGIAGGTCSGKTTLANALEKKLTDEGKRVTVVHQDSFFKRPSPTTIAPITRIEYPEHNHPDSFKLDELCAAIDEARASDAEVVIVEGMFALCLDDIREKLDLKIFVDLMSDERIVRRIKRFMQYGQTMEEITDRYIDTVRFRHNELVEPSRWHADLVFNGSATLDKSCAIISAYVNTKL